MIPEETSIGVDSGLTLIKHVTNYLHLNDAFAHNQVGGQEVFKHFLEYTPLEVFLSIRLKHTSDIDILGTC